VLLHVIARGRIGRSPEADLLARYRKRMSWPIRFTELPDKGGRMPEPTGTHRTALLDEGGRDLSSEELAAQLQNWRDAGVREARFLIGAADGFDGSERASADLEIAFGRATWPHLLARAMLAEQLYRAMTIIAGHPYHRR
jgi:23S rRNA (pseudouridine1915-N3)-methyltransferase